VTRYMWVAARKAEGFPITMAVKAAKVSRQAFWDWRAKKAAGPTETELAEVDLVELMREIHDEMNGTYGEPRMTAELARRGRPVNHKRVRRLMAVHGLVGVHKPAKVRTTIPAEDNPPMPDLIGRRFTPAAPDVAWVGDITYIRTGEGWLYLASVIDLGSRRLLGYSMADHMRTELVADALRMAVATRGGATVGIIFHGDRGCQYMSGEYRQLVKDLGMRQSVGRTGVCWDNAVAESAWSSLKRELVHRHRFATRAQARRAIFGWINTYNHRRLHSSLGYIPPIEWEQRYRQPQANQAA
jgi:putative transposase